MVTGTETCLTRRPDLLTLRWTWPLTLRAARLALRKSVNLLLLQVTLPTWWLKLPRLPSREPTGPPFRGEVIRRLFTRPAILSWVTFTSMLFLTSKKRSCMVLPDRTPKFRKLLRFTVKTPLHARWLSLRYYRLVGLLRIPRSLLDRKHLPLPWMTWHLPLLLWWTFTSLKQFP